MKRFSLKSIMIVSAFLVTCHNAVANDIGVKFERGNFTPYVSKFNPETGEKIRSVYWVGKKMISDDGKCRLEFHDVVGLLEREEGGFTVQVPKLIKTTLPVSCDRKVA